MSEIEQLERILNSPPLVTSPSLSRFLRYVVEETLAGRGAAIREYTLGVNVFDRGQDFNPRLDPIVRVQARNLRARLARYYETQGAADLIRIELPKGNYVPLFQPAPAIASAMSPEERAPAADESPPDPASDPAETAAHFQVGAPASVMPVPPPRSPVADRRRAPRYIAAIVVVLIVLTGAAVLFHGGPRPVPGLVRAGTLAEDLYIRGRYALDRETEASLRESVMFLEQAVAHAPRDAAAHAGLADAYNLTAQFGLSSPRDAMEKARAEARSAIQLDPRLAEGHIALAAVIEAYEWNWKEAEREYRLALQLNPGLAAAHLWYGMFLRDQGRLEEALPELRRAAQLQPYSVLTTVNLAYGLLEHGDAQAALEEATRAVDMAPDQPTARVLMVYAAHAMSRPAEVREALESAERLSAGNGHALSMVACALARYGRREESEKVARELNLLAKRQYVSPYDLGKVSLLLGDEDRAFRLFEQAYQERSSGLIFLRNVRGLVRDTSRLDALIGRLHLEG